jgi:hypothetical protein
VSFNYTNPALVRVNVTGNSGKGGAIAAHFTYENCFDSHFTPSHHHAQVGERTVRTKRLEHLNFTATDPDKNKALDGDSVVVDEAALARSLMMNEDSHSSSGSPLRRLNELAQ